MKVLVIGSGGREHAIVWKLSQSKMVDKIYCAPGNGGIAQLAECVSIGVMDKQGMIDFSLENKIDLVVVAPDDPLADGMVDALEAAGIKAFGPRKNAAIIDGNILDGLLMWIYFDEELPKIEVIAKHDTDFTTMPCQYSHPHSISDPTGRWIVYNSAPKKIFYGPRSDIFAVSIL